MYMQESNTLHPQPPLYRELVPQLLSHAVLLIAMKWIFLSVPYTLQKRDGYFNLFSVAAE